MNLLDTPVDQPDERAELLAKWKDKPLEDVLNAKVESDLYIKTLERQKDELRADYLKQRDELLAKAKFEDLVDRLQNPDRQVTPPPVKDIESPKFDPKEMEALIASKISESKSLDIQTDNFKKVEAKLRERYGDNFASTLKEQQNTLRLSDDDINNLAKKSPEAFFRMMGLDQQQKRDSFQTPPRSDQRADSFAPKVHKRDWNYYQELKKTNPKLYLDPKIAVQMHNDAIELGDAFGL